MNDSTLRFLQQENARLKQENSVLKEENRAIRGYMDALKELYWATQAITSEENIFDLLDKILYSAMLVIQADAGSLLLQDEETDELVFVLVHGDIEQRLRGYRIPGEQGIAGWVAQHSEPLIVNHPRQDWRFSGQIDTEFDFFTHSLICVPMITRERLIGVIELLNKRDEGEFIETDATLLLILGQVAAIALEELRIEMEAEEAASEAQSAPVEQS